MKLFDTYNTISWYSIKYESFPYIWKWNDILKENIPSRLTKISHFHSYKIVKVVRRKNLPISWLFWQVIRCDQSVAWTVLFEEILQSVNVIDNTVIQHLMHFQSQAQPTHCNKNCNNRKKIWEQKTYSFCNKVLIYKEHNAY